ASTSTASSAAAARAARRTAGAGFASGLGGVIADLRNLHFNFTSSIVSARLGQVVLPVLPAHLTIGLSSLAFQGSVFFGFAMAAGRLRLVFHFIFVQLLFRLVLGHLH